MLSLLKKYKGRLYDIGCGNGRDVIFFNKKNILCTGIDKSKEAIKKNKKKFNLFQDSFVKKNFCDLLNKKKKENISIYSRFTLHAINYKEEKILLNSFKNAKNMEYLFIECRTLKDELYGIGKKIGKHEFVTSHYRRFIDPKILKNKLKKNFKILYFKQSKNFAKFKNENPCVLRLIAKKK